MLEDGALLPFRSIVIAAASASQVPHLESAARCLVVPGSQALVEVIHVEGQRESALDLLLSAARDFATDLLVVGARSHTLASRLAMLAPCSVLMVPDEQTFSLDHVVVPIDFSPHSGEALRLAVSMADQGGTRTITALSVDSGEEPIEIFDAGGEGERLNELERLLRRFIEKNAGAGHAIHRVVAPLQRSAQTLLHPGLSLPHAIEGADVAATIKQAAAQAGATLIVVGTRGRSRSAAVLLGSVAEKLIQFAECSVLAVKHPGSHLSMLEAILTRIAQPNLTHTN